MRISIIVAMDANGVIGRDNALPWRLPEDLRRFKQITMGHPLVMGRRTYESIGRPLPGRKNIVITRRSDFHPEGVVVAHSLDEALALAEHEEVFIAGGGDIYRQALPLAHRMYVTAVEGTHEGDTFFPPFNSADWEMTADEPHEGFRFRVYERRPGVVR